MEIQLNPKTTTGVERAVEVTVPAAEVAAAEERTTKRYASQARLPGFRPGKAPAAVVRKKFAEAIRNETIESVVREAYKEIVEKDNIQVASQPHIHDLKFEEGSPLTFEFHYEVRPTVELGRTNGFKVRREPTTVTDEQLQEQIDRLRDERAAWAPVEGKPIEGDMVSVGLSVADDEGKLGEPRDVSLVLGDGKAIAGIEELIMEAGPGETVERPVRWPEDFPEEAQRGQTKTVRATVHEVKRKSLPTLDDAFAREVGDFDSADALRTAVRQDMEKFAQRESEAHVRQGLIDQVIAANPFDVPRSWVGQLVDNYAETYQVPPDQRAQFDTEFTQVAERQIKRDLIVEAIAEQEKLAASERDLDDRIAEQAAERGVEPGQLYTALEKSGRLKDLERTITEDKVFKWLVERNDIVTEA
ncbi:MAG TPA: trigger factor [Gemmatimonadaceae bacterium]|nr:trigger factor [Gemmatimonadaceae bacterium]